MKGKGLIYRNDVILFEGEFKDNYFVKGKKFLSNGQYYIGQFKKYKMEGKGVIFNKNISKVYEGEFLDEYYFLMVVIMKVNLKKIKWMEK